MILRERKYLQHAMQSQDYQDPCNLDFDVYICLHIQVSVKVLSKLMIAHIVGKAVWRQGGDIRDVISIGKLVRKIDGPEEVEQILRTMIKYGEMKEH